MSMAMTPTKDIMRRKQTVPAERTKSFFKSKLGLARLRKAYLRFAKISVKPNSSPERSKETVKRSSVMVTEWSESSSILYFLSFDFDVHFNFHCRYRCGDWL
mmetsp:Transcript_5892/g.13430  ORF Transcript_5892/g.13430 Transcript_5892/m.13430 type:complete len:102 (-) Transcript_5892:103-408(-)